MTCAGGVCHQCMAVKLVVIGLVVLANEYYGAPFINWFYLLGALLVVKGLLTLVMPHCPHCPPESSGKKKRR